MTEQMRLHKFLSRSGVASRREGERLIAAGRVRVNGDVVTRLGSRVDPKRDRVELDGELIQIPAPRWIAFHKPPGVLTTRSDPHGGRTVFDELPGELRSLRYVGRLDRDTDGLLLLTNDGETAHALLHPSGEVEREYLARVTGEVGPKTVRALLAGVELDDGLARARRAAVLARSPRGSTLSLVLTEGRKREVRRMLDVLGHPVLALTRTRFGPIELGQLARGQWRDLSEEERAALEERADG